MGILLLKMGFISNQFATLLSYLEMMINIKITTPPLYIINSNKIFIASLEKIFFIKEIRNIRVIRNRTFFVFK